MKPKTEIEQRRWSYIYPGENDEAVEEILTEDEILREYYPYWSAQMTRVGKSDMLTAQNCIDDWVMIHWAKEV